MSWTLREPYSVMHGGTGKQCALLLGLSAVLVCTAGVASPQESGAVSTATSSPSPSSCLSIEECAKRLRVPSPAFSHNPTPDLSAEYGRVFSGVLETLRNPRDADSFFCASLLAGTSCFVKELCWEPGVLSRKPASSFQDDCSCENAGKFLDAAIKEMVAKPGCGVESLRLEPGFPKLLGELTDKVLDWTSKIPPQPAPAPPPPPPQAPAPHPGPIQGTRKPAPLVFTLEHEGEVRYVNTGRPVFQGIGTKGSTVIVQLVDRSNDGLSEQLESVVDFSGQWKVDEGNYPYDLHDGEYIVRAFPEGRGSQKLLKTMTLVVDTQPPLVEVKSPTAGSRVSGYNIVVELQVESGSTAVVNVCGQKLTAFDFDVQGNTWIKSLKRLVGGTCGVSVTAKDKAGNTFAHEVPFEIITTPPKLAIVSPVNGARVNQSRPVFEGVAELGSTLSVELEGVGLRKVVLSGEHWRIGPEHYLHDLAERPEPYVFRFLAEDGLKHRASMEIRLTVDKTPPRAAVTSPAVVNLDDAQPVFEGTAEPDSKVVVNIDGYDYGDVLVEQSGRWTIRPRYLGALSDGRHQVTITATDQARNSVYVHPFVKDGFINIDTSRPDIESVELDFSLSKKRPAFTGRSKKWSTVSVSVDGKELGVIDADSKGSWRTDPNSYPALAAGSHSLLVSATDRFGRTGKEVKKDFSIEPDLTLSAEPGVELMLERMGVVPYASLALEFSLEPQHWKPRLGFVLVGAFDWSNRFGVYGVRSGPRLHLDYVYGYSAISVYGLAEGVVLDEIGWLRKEAVRLRLGVGVAARLNGNFLIKVEFAPEYRVRASHFPEMKGLLEDSWHSKTWLSMGLGVVR